LAPFSEALQAFIDSKDLKHKTGWKIWKRKKTVDEGGPLVPWEMVNTVFMLRDTAIRYKASLENIEALNMALPKYLGTQGSNLKRINSFLQKCVTESQLKDEHALRLRLDDCRQAKANGQYLSWRKVAAKPFDVPEPKKDEEDIQSLIDSLGLPTKKEAKKEAKAKAKEAKEARKRDKRKRKDDNTYVPQEVSSKMIQAALAELDDEEEEFWMGMGERKELDSWKEELDLDI
jgi:hypothetical protein